MYFWGFLLQDFKRAAGLASQAKALAAQADIASRLAQELSQQAGFTLHPALSCHHPALPSASMMPFHILAFFCAPAAPELVHPCRTLPYLITTSALPALLPCSSPVLSCPRHLSTPSTGG